MESPWRTVALAVALTVVSVVVLNAQSFWLNLRYKVAPQSFAATSTIVPIPGPGSSVVVVTPTPTVTTPVQLPSPKPIGISNANLAKIPLGGTNIYISPAERANIDMVFAKKQTGKLFVQVQSRGELWYVNPADDRRYRVPTLSAASAFIAALQPASPSITVAQPAPGANTITITSLGLRVPIVYITEANEKAFQRGLKSGAVHYPGTALPGQFGNVYIFGHSSDYWWSDGLYKTVFAVLPQIKVGAEIIVTNPQGQAFTYRVFAGKVVAAKDVSYLGQYKYQRKILTVQTSWPIGTALKRYVVLAELVPN